MNAAPAVLALCLVACGGAVTQAEDAGAFDDASPVEAATSGDASLDVAAPDGDARADAATEGGAPVCTIEGVDYPCAPGSLWTWGIAVDPSQDGLCSDAPCIAGHVCELVDGGTPGACN